MKTIVTKNDGARRMEFDEKRFKRSINSKAVDLKIHTETMDKFISDTIAQITAREEIDFRDITQIAIQNALTFVDDIKDDEGMMDFDKLNNTDLQFLASRLLLASMYKRASRNRAYSKDDKYGDFYGLLNTLGEKGLLDRTILRDYSEAELKEAGSFIVADRDKLIPYIGMFHLLGRYLIRDKDVSRSVYELPQERFLIQALTVSRLEPKEVRMQHVKEAYDEASKLNITMATPTLTNTGRPDGQFSSCFILSTEDSLRGIYDDNTDAAMLSKNGGGIGHYLGKVRAKGSDIRGNQNAAGGVVGWIKQMDTTAVNVDQLGVRKGAIAEYLDVWHLDIQKFVELRLNTGDLSERAHNVFLGVNFPDEYMRQIEARGDWYLFDPREVSKVMGFNLEDFYDKKLLGEKETPNEFDHAFTYHYRKCIDSTDLKLKKRVPAIEIHKAIMKSRLETGVPYMLFRDTVNRANPNKHAGMIYSSNLCSEIAQNQTPTVVTGETIDENGVITTTKEAGDFVTCNLSSTVLNNVLKDLKTDFSNWDECMAQLRQTIRVQTRMTDNVIEVNRLPILQAQFTNQKYRAIGLGQQGIAALLARLQIQFDSEIATAFIAKLEEMKMLFTIEASADLAAEKGSYKVFEGSDWNTGEWFDTRAEHMTSDKWDEVKTKAMSGMRNGYLQAVAPTGSTSLIAGSTASADTVFDVIFQEGKKDASLPVIAPGLNQDTWFYYKPTKLMEYDGESDLGHMWAIQHNAARQVWVDQAVSFNTYVTDNIKARNLLRIDIETWKQGIKTAYYTRASDARRDDDCLACSA